VLLPRLMSLEKRGSFSHRSSSPISFAQRAGRDPVGCNHRLLDQGRIGEGKRRRKQGAMTGP
jgi:hypothetical protein